MGVHLAGEHALEFKLAHVGFQALRVALDVARGGLVVLALGEVQQFRGIGDALDGAVDLTDVRAQARAFAPELLGTRGIGPHGRLLEFAGYLLEALLFAVVLKETPVTLRRVRRGL